MNRFKFKNKAGWVKFNYRRIFWLFGKKVYYVTGVVCAGGYARKTSVKYLERESAVDTYSIIRDILVKESDI